MVYQKLGSVMLEPDDPLANHGQCARSQSTARHAEPDLLSLLLNLGEHDYLSMLALGFLSTVIESYLGNNQ